MATVDVKRMYSPREAADLLGVTADTVKTYCRDGRLKGRQIGPRKQWSVSGAEIKRLRKAWNLD